MHKLTARALRKKFAEGELSATEITSHFLKRIADEDKAIGAFLSVLDERALAKAALLDKKRAAGEPLGKLAAVPVAIKDNIHIEGEISTCGSRFLTNYRAPFSATAVRRLEEEDAILIGKTNMDEFAMGSSTENSALKQSANPWDLKRVPGGSSGGSAAAVAARLCPLALGSDTGGSVRQPASFCGVVGIKPTYGRISRYGLVAYGSSLDQIGPLTYDVEDNALATEVIASACKKDSTSIGEEPDAYAEGLKNKLGPYTIGVPWQFLDKLAEEPKAKFHEAIEHFRSLGAEIVDVDLSLLKYSIATYYILATAEASTNLARFDGVRYGNRSSSAKTLKDVYDLSKEEGFGPEVKRRILLGTYVLSAGYQDAYYKKAQKVRTLIIRQFNSAFETCSAIAMPVTPFTAFEQGAIQDPVQMYLEDIYTISANLAGIPAISIPNGLSAEGMPLGLQLLAKQRAETELFKIAYDFEQKAGHHLTMPGMIK